MLSVRPSISISKISNLCGPYPPTSQTDGQTDRRTTCDGKTDHSSSRGKNKSNANLSSSTPVICDRHCSGLLLYKLSLVIVVTLNFVVRNYALMIVLRSTAECVGSVSQYR